MMMWRSRILTWLFAEAIGILLVGAIGLWLGSWSVFLAGVIGTTIGNTGMSGLVLAYDRWVR